MRFLRKRRQLTLYLAVGVWNTAFGYGEWALLQFAFGGLLHYLVILVAAWPIAVLNAYLCYRNLVFHSKGRMRDELPRFSVVYLATLLGSLVALPFLLGALPLSIYVIQAGYTITVVILSFLAHRFFSFKDPLAAAPAAPSAGGDDAGT
jgi:putative flippase GtrA